jgi:hypothetical protein
MLKKIMLFAALAIAATTWTAGPASAQYYSYQGPGYGPGNGPGCGPPGVYGCGPRHEGRYYGWSGYRYHRSPWSSDDFYRTYRHQY